METTKTAVCSRWQDTRSRAHPRNSRARTLATRCWNAALRRMRQGLASVEAAFRLPAVPLLMQAADHWPAESALRLAGALASGLSLLPPHGCSRGYARRCEAHGPAAGLSPFEKPHLGAAFRDFIMVRRVNRGMEDPRSWAIAERNAEAVNELRDTGLPFILATGHFSRWASILLYTREVIPHDLTVIVAGLPATAHGPSQLWNQVNYRQMLDLLRKLRVDVKFLRLGDREALRGLIHDLQTPGHAAVIAADTPWPDFHANSIIRPFGGSTARAFSTGTARLARLAGCPIAVCVPFLNESGTVVIDWRRMIPPPANGGEAKDQAITNLILDEIESAALARPEQYVIDLLR